MTDMYQIPLSVEWRVTELEDGTLAL